MNYFEEKEEKQVRLETFAECVLGEKMPEEEEEVFGIEDTVEFEVPYTWLQKWCEAHRKNVDWCIEDYTQQQAEEVFYAAEQDHQLKIIEVNHPICKRYMRVNLYMDELVEEFSLLHREHLGIYLTTEDKKAIKEILKEYKDSGCVEMAMYGNECIALECTLNGTLITDTHTFKDLEDLNHYLVSIRVAFGEAQEIIKRIVRSFSPYPEEVSSLVQSELAWEQESSTMDNKPIYTVRSVEPLAKETFYTLRAFL